MCRGRSAKRRERTETVHRVVGRDRLVYRLTLVVDIPLRVIFKASAGRDADWRLLVVERERLAREAEAVAVQSHVLIGVDVVGLYYLWARAGVPRSLSKSLGEIRESSNQHASNTGATWGLIVLKIGEILKDLDAPRK